MCLLRGTGWSSSMMQVSFLFTDCAMEQAVICRPLTVHDQVRCQVSTFEFCGGQSDRVLPFPPVNIIPPTPQARLHLNVALTRRTNGRRLGTFPKEKLFRKFGSLFSLFFLLTSLMGII